MNKSKIALFAGATALMVLAPQARAQTSVDALLNKLEQKGILSVDEARELKAENATNSVNDLNKAFNSRFPMPDWVTSYKLNGDFRGRFEDFTGDNVNFADRIRFRYRLRVGLLVNMKDDLQAGFRLGSSDAPSGFSNGSPLSNNSTFQDNGTKKPVYIDTAYGRWTPINNDTWQLVATVGKMDQPFLLSPMEFDPDYTPEGASLQTIFKINDKHSLTFNSAAFVLDEESTSSQDPFLYGGQIIWDAKWSPRFSSALGVAAFDIVNRDMLTTANVPFVNQGNTRLPAMLPSGTIVDNLIYNYNPIIASGSVTYTLDTFPFYTGAFPIKLASEFMDNPGAAHDNVGYWAGITFGKSGKKGTWDLSYRYEHLEADAWYDQLVDDDNGAYYQAQPNPAWHTVGSPPGSTFNWYGGTNVKGHLIKFNYSITDAFMFTVTCYINDLINQNIGGVAEPNSGAIHAMADIMWKF